MQQERRNDIVFKIRKSRIVKVNDLMDEYHVSIETIRRDLEFLESEGYLRRVYGGAVLNDFYRPEQALSQREQTNYLQKQAIGKLAVDFIEDGDTIYIDSGTTTIELTKHLGEKRNLTIITNALLIAREAMISNYDCRVIMLGGELRRNELATSGTGTTADLNNFYMTKAFLSAGGISLKSGVTEYDLHDAENRRLIPRRAEKIIMLADYSKFGITTMNYIMPIEDISVLITDWNVPESVLEPYRSRGIEIHVAQPL
ncbi:MAG: DeoR/GlpR family DNA-binding transcription regulator [Treponema sp.]|jgi:DeoR/GlpR family transcriptional regulator of sugar metabolism|nr:DeoR/GlpR family DNA-binding transcription regulator [Treponema sp.]